MFQSSKHLPVILVVLASVSGCQSKLSVKGSSKAKTQQDTPVEFHIIAPEQVEPGEKFSISWTELKDATYTLVMAGDDSCANEFIRFSNIRDAGQETTITETGKYHICVSAQKEDETFPAANNGLALRVGDFSEDTDSKDGKGGQEKNPDSSPASPSAPAPSGPVVTNTPPSFSFTGLSGPSPMIAQNGMFEITWSDSDPDDDAAIAVYAHTVTGGACAGGTPIGTGIAEDDGENKLLWNTSGVSPGTWFFCARIADAVNPAVEVWSPSPLVINSAPQIGFVQPAGGDDRIAVNGTFNISWTDQDSDDDAALTFHYSTTSGGSCVSGVQIGGVVPENGVNSLAWDTTGLASTAFYICGRIDDGINPPVEAWSPSPVYINEAPTIAVLEPGGANDSIPEDNVFAITWTDSDGDDDATISFFYKTNNTGACSTGTAIAGTVSEDAGVNSFDWDTTGVGHGDFYVCARISDGYDAAESWSSTALRINDRPTINVNNPGQSSFNEYRPGDLVPVTWTDSDADDDAVVTIYYKPTNTGACSAGGTQIGTPLSENGSNSIVWDTDGLPHGSYYICIQVADSINPVVTDYSLEVALFIDCTWNGSASDDWFDPANWSGCLGAPPVNTDKVLVPSAVGTQPRLTASTSIGGFSAAGPGGGSITIDPGATLNIRDQGRGIESSIEFIAASPACTSCAIRFGFDNKLNDLYIVNNATLTINEGISLIAADWTSTLYVGNGTSAGHFRTGPGGSDPALWPSFNGGTNRYLGFLRVNGTPTTRSTIHINGIRVKDLKTDLNAVELVANFEVLRFDNVVIEYEADQAAASYIRFTDCSNAVISDFTWRNLTFVDKLAPGVFYNIDAGAATCAALPAFSVTGAGSAHGSALANDPHGKLTWSHSVEEVCIWNPPTSSTNWFSSGNWDNCINSRGGIPDRWSWIIVPTGAISYPVLSANASVFGFQKAAGGGTVTVRENTTFTVYDDIASSVVFTGDDTSSAVACSTCLVTLADSTSSYESIAVIEGATLTLGTEIRLRMPYSTTLNIGNGRSPGGFVASGGPDSGFWPLLDAANFLGGIRVEGAPGSPSNIDLNGLRLNSIRTSSESFGFYFDDYYSVTRFDNVRLTTQSNGSLTAGSFIHFGDCTNATVVSAWQNIDFYSPITSPGAFNVRASDPSCAALGPLDFSSSTGAGGIDNYENDPYNRINW